MITTLPSRVMSMIKAMCRACRRIFRPIASENATEGWENRINRERFREEVYARAKIGSGCEHI